MQKAFDDWNELKKKLDQNWRQPYVHHREVWWCSLGQNIGAEIDGKNESVDILSNDQLIKLKEAWKQSL